jgi:NTE family protein
MIRSAVTRPWHFRPVAAAMALLAPGAVDIRDQLTALRRVEDQDWPQDPLWICSVRRRDGRRAVFGRPGTPEVPLHLAVASSCAVPAYFAPVQIGGQLFVDGGAHSPTNAATLRPCGLDLVIIVSPMSGPSGGPTKDLYEASRWHATRLVRREAAALRATGTDVVVFRPGPEEQEAMGDDLMSSDTVVDVVQQSFLGAGAHAAQAHVRKQLAGMNRPKRRRASTVAM